MKLYVFSVRDSAIDAFSQPFFCRHRGEAIRSFQAAVAENKFGLAKSDYTLFSIAEFDDASGVFTSTDPQRLLSALEVETPQ